MGLSYHNPDRPLGAGTPVRYCFAAHGPALVSGALVGIRTATESGGKGKVIAGRDRT
jgi:hypothetical protein